MQTIKTNPFARAQHTPTAPRGHYNGTWEQLEAIVSENFDKGHQGYKPGVMLVPVPAEEFMSACVPCTEGMAFNTSYAPRRPGENSVITVTTTNEKVPAVAVDIVLYSHAVLMEDNDASSNADWEIIALLPRMCQEPEPMHPITMMRNFLHLAGGTQASYTAEEFAKAILYWAQHVMVEPE